MKYFSFVSMAKVYYILRTFILRYEEWLYVRLAYVMFYC